MLRFFQSLPCTTIVCISLLGGDFASLLTELLDYRSCTHAWILLSRFNSNSQPVVILVPVESVLEGKFIFLVKFLEVNLSSIKTWEIVNLQSCVFIF